MALTKVLNSGLNLDEALTSNATGNGASLVGIEDTGGNFTGTTVEEALEELADAAYSEGSPITGYTLGGIVRLSNAAAGPAVLDLDATVIEGNWTSIGPTGSSAALIWSDLDDIPLTAKGILLQAFSQVTYSTEETRFHFVGTRPTGSTELLNVNDILLAHTYDTAGAATQIVGNGIAPLDAENVFEVKYDPSSSINRTGIVQELRLIGWIE